MNFATPKNKGIAPSTTFIVYASLENPKKRSYNPPRILIREGVIAWLVERNLTACSIFYQELLRLLEEWATIITDYVRTTIIGLSFWEISCLRAGTRVLNCKTDFIILKGILCEKETTYLLTVIDNTLGQMNFATPKKQGIAPSTTFIVYASLENTKETFLQSPKAIDS